MQYDIYCTIYCSKHGASDVEYFEMSYNHSYGKEMTAKKQEQPYVLPPPQTKSVD